MSINRRYRQFLVELLNDHKDNKVLESALNAYEVIFESKIDTYTTVDSSEADQLSHIVKTMDIDKKHQNDIYLKFIEIDSKKTIPYQSVTIIFNKLKNMIDDFNHKRVDYNGIINYLNQFL